MAEGSRLQGSVAIVTGASEGIAEETARTLAREGASVALVSRTLERTQRVAAEIEAGGGAALALRADVTKAAEVESAVSAVLAKWGRIDILVNGVGGFHGKATIEEISEAQWDEVIAVNMKSAFLCARAVARRMKEQGSGRIINIGSQAGTAPNPHSDSYLPYGAAKAGLIGFTKHLAKELGRFGITVNIVSPGTTLTPRARKNRDAAAIERLVSQSPMRSLVEPRDTAEAVLFLASGAAGHITGVNLNVNAGGMIL
jgi:NAD(P)-dependent dehydrogenase (short-subunit alcohol dehydrogenase family)